MEVIFLFIYNVFFIYYIKRIRSSGNVGKRLRNCILNNLIGIVVRERIVIGS